MAWQRRTRTRGNENEEDEGEDEDDEDDDEDDENEEAQISTAARARRDLAGNSRHCFPTQGHSRFHSGHLAQTGVSETPVKKIGETQHPRSH